MGILHAAHGKAPALPVFSSLFQPCDGQCLMAVHQLTSFEGNCSASYCRQDQQQRGGAAKGGLHLFACDRQCSLCAPQTNSTVCCMRVCEQRGQCETGQKAEWMHGSVCCICTLLCQHVPRPGSQVLWRRTSCVTKRHGVVESLESAACSNRLSDSRTFTPGTPCACTALVHILPHMVRLFVPQHLQGGLHLMTCIFWIV